MRVNVYSQEITNEVTTIVKPGELASFVGIAFTLHSSERLHHTDADDDRSAVTFWLPKSDERCEDLASAFERAATLVRLAVRNR